MAQKIRKKTLKQTKKTSASPFNIYWERKNYLLLGLGFLLTVIGFYFMGQEEWNSFSSLVISPIILFIAYVLIFPLSIFLRKKSDNEKVQENDLDAGKS